MKVSRQKEFTKNVLWIYYHVRATTLYDTERCKLCNQKTDDFIHYNEHDKELDELIPMWILGGTTVPARSNQPPVYG